MKSQNNEIYTGGSLPLASASSGAMRPAVASATSSAGDTPATPTPSINTGDIPFTVKECIDILKTFPEYLPVLVSGYNSGYEGFYYPEIVNLVHLPENMYRDGEYQLPEKGESPDLSAVVLLRVNRDD